MEKNRKQLVPPYRLGNNQRRAVLDSNGSVVVIFPFGREDMAEEYVKFLNREHCLSEIMTADEKDGLYQGQNKK